MDWLGDSHGCDVLCLGSGGGQQAPILAAAGYRVTLLDISDEQLAIDVDVCNRHSLEIRIDQGSMTDLTRFNDASFTLIINPVSNPYVADVRAVWKECARVLRPKGRLIAGSINPLNYLFEENEGDEGEGLEVRFSLPYVESETLAPDELQEAISRDMVFTWSHSLEDLIQGQADAGFLIAGLHESLRTDPRAPSINRYSPTYIQTLAIRGAA
jgi:SAM-dependent methyltransferase